MPQRDVETETEFKAMADEEQKLTGKERLYFEVWTFLKTQGVGTIMLAALVAGMWIGGPKAYQEVKNEFKEYRADQAKQLIEQNTRHLEEMKAFSASHLNEVKEISQRYDSSLKWHQQLNERLMGERGIHGPKTSTELDLDEPVAAAGSGSGT